MIFDMAVPGSDNKGLCYWCVKIVKWIPVLLIVAIVAWSYYAYVIQLCLFTVESLAQKVIYLIFYHLFFFMFSWSYWQAVFTDIGRVPSEYKIRDADYEAYMNDSDSYERRKTILEVFARHLPMTNICGRVRFCEKCKIIKPDRAHHCSVCGVCVLKMDHHCPWINNCVSFTNYKFFVLLLGYAFAFCTYLSLTSLPYCISFWTENIRGLGRYHILFLFFFTVMFGVSVLTLFGYHCYLVCENKTTLEAFSPPRFRGVGADRYGFHVGRYKNFQEVFGDDPKTWFFPVSTSLGDGIGYPIRSRHQQSFNPSLDNTQSSTRDSQTETSMLSSDHTEISISTIM